MSKAYSSRRTSSITSEDLAESEKNLVQDENRADHTTNAFNEKSIILLQFQPQFQAVVMSGMLLSFISTMVDATFAFSTEEKNIPVEYHTTLLGIIYCIDVVYIIDILLMIVYRSSKWSNLKHLYDKRPAWLLTLDIISVIPIDAVYFSLTVATMKYIYLLRLRYSLRIFRFLIKIKEIERSIEYNSIYMEMATFTLKLITVITIMTCIVYRIHCQFNKCLYRDIVLFLDAIHVVYEEATNQGFPNPPHPSEIIATMLLTLKLFAFVYINGFIVAVVLLRISYKIRKKHNFKNMQTSIIRNMEICGCNDPLIISAGKQFCALNYKNRQGFSFHEFDHTILPEAMRKDLDLDICWDALKHSHLFRDKDVSFLRVLSSIMIQTCMMPGEVIFKRGQLKSSMIYVASGIIQVLSELDSETPIISLTRGTCISETSLFLSNPAISTVVCHNSCKLIILNKKDLVSIILKYPDEFRILKQEIKNKLIEIKSFENFLDDLFSDEHNKRESLSLKWLKVTFKELTSKHENIPERERKVLTLDDRKTCDTTNMQLFSATNLDKMVICEDIELVTDTVFMKVNCPCIIQPDSFVVAIWNSIISWTALIFVCIYPYYASFEPITSVWFETFSYVVLCLWVLDIYINLSTAIKTSDHIISNFSEIVYMKITNVSFIIDVLAVIPLGLFVRIIQDMPLQTQVLLQMPRILKFYKIKYIFKESLSMMDDIPRTYLENTLYLLLLIYYFAAFMHINVCYNSVCKPNNKYLVFIEHIVGNKEYPVLMWIYLSSVQISNLGIELRVEGYDNNIPMNALTLLISLAELGIITFSVYFIAMNAAIVAMSKYDKYKLENYIFSLKMAMKDLSVKPKLQKQVLRHIDGQVQFNNCFNILYSFSTLQKNFNAEIYNEFRSTSFSHYLKKIPIFQELPDQIISSIAQAFYINLMVPNEVITYYGQICTERHVIVSGFCAIVTNTGKITKILKPGDIITEIELCFKIPAANTIITLTHCKLLSANYVKLMNWLQKYPQTLWYINNTIDIIKETTNLEVLYVQDTTNLDIDILLEDESKSIINVGYMSRDTNESAQYYAYFDEHEFLGFLKYILMRSVFPTYGKFIKYWEVSRCIFALLTITFTRMITMHPCTNCGWNYFLYFLDATAWIDIYIRHHITYFNEINIEVIHPIKTASYYWKHAFITDLIAVLPFEFIVGSFILNNKIRAFLRVPRFLQSYRILAAIKYLTHRDLGIPIELWTIIKYIPFLAIFINNSAYIYISSICQFHPNIAASAVFEAGVKCDDNTWITKSDFAKPISPLRVHLYCLFSTSVILLKPAIGGFNIVNQMEALQIMFAVIIGILIYMHVTANILAVNLFRNIDLPIYQQGMSSLVKFLTYKRIDPKLRQEVINHFEYIWRKQKGKNLCTMITGGCKEALQGDVLYDVFGVAMSNSIIFKGAPTSFFKGVLLNAKHDIIMKRGIITQVNTVHADIYIIFKGHVEVLGPDYNRLLVLSVGSIFGNIDNFPMSRQTLTMVAKGHVELLTITSTKFHLILSKYSQLKTQYHKLIGLNADYLVGTEDKSPSDFSLQTTKDISRLDTTLSLKSLARLENLINMFEEYSKTIKIVWESFILIFPCFLGIVLELYINAVLDVHTYLIAILYVFDALFIFKIIFKFFTAYEDEFGILVNDQQKIAKAYVKDRRGFSLDVASVFPFEIIALLFQRSNKFWYIWIHCRSNRFIRVYFIYNYLNKKNQQLNINVRMIRTLTLIFWMYICLQTLTTILITITCINPNYNITPVLKCDWLNLKSQEKMKIYKNHFEIILNLFAVGSMSTYIVNSSILIVFVVILLLCCKIVQISTIAEVAATLDSVFEIQGDYEDNMKLLEGHMKEHQTSPALMERIWLYICILWKKKEGVQFPKFLEVTPYYLREAILNSMFGVHLRKHPILGKCHVDLLRQMAAHMETRVFLTGDYVAFMNDYDECMYFVHEGSVDALSEDDMESEKIEYTYKKNSMFGLHQGLYLRSGHEYSYRANRYTIIVILKRFKWIHLLNFFPASQEIIYNQVKQ